MGGGLMQLVAYGAQDIYLTGNPQITFFKVVYRRHTNFAMEAIEQTFNGSADFGKKVTCTVSRNGDLVSRMYLEAELPAVNANTGSSVWASKVGHQLVKNVEVEVGGQRVDKHYADWLEVWSQLTTPDSKSTGYAGMVDNSTAATGTFVDAVAQTDSGLNLATGAQNITATQVDLNIGAYTLAVTDDGTNITDVTFTHTAGTYTADAVSGNSSTSATINLKKGGTVIKQLDGTTDNVVTIAVDGADIKVTSTGFLDGSKAVAAKRLYVPLQFWFCRNPGLALPLIALQYHEVKVNMEFDTFANVKTSAMESTTGALSSASLWVDYVYLDTDERRRFAQVSHEYLIEQLQFTGDESFTSTSRSLRLNFNHPVKELVWVGTTATRGSYDGNLSTAKLQLNGHDRFAERKGSYFNFVQPYQHHTAMPSGNVYVYSFALKPEEHQPSGTCNFSRIDNATLQLTWSTAPAGGLVRVYAVNYNVLRVMSGMGGLAYSN